jgi:hypothetical protein
MTTHEHVGGRRAQRDIIQHILVVNLLRFGRTAGLWPLAGERPRLS